MKQCKCEHWETCPVCYPQGFDESGVRKPVEIPPTRDEMLERIKNLKAERDELAEKLKYASMAATAEAHRCDELAAQVEKMRNPADVLLEIVGRIQPFALPREEDTQQKRYERLRKAYCIAQPWPIPDQACLVWRADLMHMAGDLVHKQAYFDNEKRKRDSALAADMEAT